VQEPEADKEVTPEAESKPVIEAPGAQQETPTPAASLNKLNGKKKKKKKQQHSQHSPQHEEILEKQALEQQEVKEVLVFFQKYAKPATVVIVLICALVLADKFFKSKRQGKNLRADTALMNAQNAEDLQTILDDYASTPAAPMALMGLAREKFNTGQIDEAEALYAQFIKKHGDLEQATQAELSLIACKESKGKLGEAHLLYGKFAKDHEGSYLVPAALMGRARCLEALGELDEAQIAYEDLIVNHPESSWARMAETNLKMVLAKKQ
jgi:TolA-binding protein